MNTPGVHNGIIQSWFDGELVLDRDNIRYRDVDTFSIDKFYFDTFYGGSSILWAPSVDVYSYFDNFIIYETSSAQSTFYSDFISSKGYFLDGSHSFSTFITNANMWVGS